MHERLENSRARIATLRASSVPPPAWRALILATIALAGPLSVPVVAGEDDPRDSVESRTQGEDKPSPKSGTTAFLPIEDVQIGMRGVGRTVFQGNTIEEFDIEILGVLRNTRPQGDLILFRGHGDVLEHAGIIRGMSGSPVYIDGKLVGAVSFAYPGTIDPIGAITPIGEMLPLLDMANGDEASKNGRRAGAGNAIMPGSDPTPGSIDSNAFDRVDGVEGGGLSQRSSESEGSGVSGRPAQGNWSQFQGAWNEFLAPSSAMSAGAFGAPEGAASLANRFPAPQNQMPDGNSVGEMNGFAPLTTPVSMSGWSPVLSAPMAAAMQGLGFAVATVPGGAGTIPAAGESVARGEPGSESLDPGSAVGVRLIGGDADLVAIGTVTYVDSERILAFGHPMMQAGDVAFPMTGAWIHAVIPNRQVSMKMGSSTGLVGGVWNDRRTGIAGAFGAVPATLPVAISVKDGTGDTQEFSYTVVRDKSLTPFLLPWTVANSYLVTGWVSGDAYVETTTDVYFDHGQHLRRVDRLAAEAPGVELGTDATLPATLLLINPWQETHLDSVRVDITYEPGNRSARIVEVRRSASLVHAGDVVRIEAAIEPFRGAVETYGFDLEIPEAWAGRSLDVYVGGTNDFVLWDQDRAPEKMVPHDLSHMISMIEQVPNDSQITMRVYSPETGTLIRGEELPDLPTSLAKATRNVPHVAGPRPVSGSLLEERQLTTPWVVSGGERISLEVAEQ